MKLPTTIKPAYLIGGAVLLAVAYFALRGVKGAASDVGGAVVDMADGVFGGVVQGAGSVIGIPTTSESKCQQAIREFRAAPWYEQALIGFKVSAYCPASDYLRFIGTGKAPGE